MAHIVYHVEHLSTLDCLVTAYKESADAERDMNVSVSRRKQALATAEHALRLVEHLGRLPDGYKRRAQRLALEYISALVLATSVNVSRQLLGLDPPEILCPTLGMRHLQEECHPYPIFRTQEFVEFISAIDDSKAPIHRASALPFTHNLTHQCNVQKELLQCEKVLMTRKDTLLAAITAQVDAL